MTSNATNPIFIHSLFRSGSTYIFNVFRNSGAGYWCYQEPLNEHLLFATDAPEKLLETHKQTSSHLRHPALKKPYFDEFFPLAEIIGNLFRKEFSYDEYFLSEKNADTDLITYFSALIDGAMGRPVFQCCRTAGRVAPLKSGCSGIHLFLWRNPWDQWWSYKLDIYFDKSNLLIANSPSAPAFIQKLRKDLEIETFHSSDFWIENEYIGRQRLDASGSYMLFYALWCHSMLEGRPHCDAMINIDRLSVSDSYQAEIVASLSDMGINGIDFSDCATPIGFYSKKDIDFFQRIEDQIHDLLLCHGYSQNQLDEILLLRREYSVSPNEIKNVELAVIRDAERARELARRYETELAKGCDIARDLQVKIQQVTERLQIAEERAQQTQSQLTTVYNSRSWRITSPLRILMRLLRKK